VDEEFAWKEGFMKTKSVQLVRVFVAAAVLAGLGAAVPLARAETQTIKGEVVDLMCYLDHGAKGEKHASCAKTCIESGGPAGILSQDNQLYLVIGDHKPMNDKLAPLAAKTVSIKGKVVERNGMKMIENAEIEK
jgi:hypothetical protein